MAQPFLFEILFEDPELLVINKPAGLVCHPTKTDQYSSLVSRARLYLGPGSHPQLVNRLDRETSGVTLIAKTPGSARELRRLWEQRTVTKTYTAIVHGHVASPHAVIDAPLGKDDASHIAIKDCVRPNGAPASTEFWLEKTFSRDTPSAPAQASATPARQLFSVLRVVPHTGRKHQIRIHLAHYGHPIVGDKLYGGDEDLYLALVQNRLTEKQKQRLILPYHALHAASVQFTWRNQSWHFRATPEPWFVSFIPAHPQP